MRVLIAEDEDIARRVVEKGFLRHGHECVCAANGPDALHAFQSDSFDLVVSDWNMPGFDGLSLVRKIRQLRGPYAYLVLLTGRDRSSNAVEALEGGADYFLTKPITTWALQVMLIHAERALELHRELERLRGRDVPRSLDRG